MATLPEARISSLLKPYLQEPLADEVLTKLGSYLDLLLHWNARTNLTAIRDPEQIVQRQIGESLFAAQFLPEIATVIDFGSGAGFPGIPMQLFRPANVVTLAESQGKKAAFLREAVRHLSLPAQVWAKRVEEIPSAQHFDVVTMRAVDKSEAMQTVATDRVTPGGSLLRFLGEEEPAEIEGWRVVFEHPVPLSRGRLVNLARV
jgi:16S rRNA (guanine527-N7)-methyltransferase